MGYFLRGGGGEGTCVLSIAIILSSGLAKNMVSRRLVGRISSPSLMLLSLRIPPTFSFAFRSIPLKPAFIALSLLLRFRITKHSRVQRRKLGRLLMCDDDYGNIHGRVDSSFLLKVLIALQLRRDPGAKNAVFSQGKSFYYQQSFYYQLIIST